jgi:hypothetical protein
LRFFHRIPLLWVKYQKFEYFQATRLSGTSTIIVLTLSGAAYNAGTGKT